MCSPFSFFSSPIEKKKLDSRGTCPNKRKGFFLYGKHNGGVGKDGLRS